MTHRVKNKIALVTGGARGIGAATAKLLAEESATVMITDIRDDLGQAMADSLGDNVHYRHLDVSSEDKWIQVFSDIKSRFGGLDILFNNAGISGLNEGFGPQNPEESTLESWHKVHHVNLDGVFLGCKHGIHIMKDKGGSIINMSSRSGMVGIPDAAAYASSKAAIRNHTKTVALYCARQGYNIRCNSLHPGAIMTPMWDSLFEHSTSGKEQAIAEIAAGIPIGHMGEPEDVAQAVVYLGSDESKYLTGIELTIDGGILAGATSALK